MKKRFFRNRRMRYASVSAILTVLVIVAVLLANSVFGSLAKRYQWAIPMNAEANYDVTGVCYSLLDRAFASVTEENTAKRHAPVKLIFCDTEKVWREDVTQSYLYHSARTLDARYEQLTVEFHDLFLDPTVFADYTVHPETQEPIRLNTTDLIVACEDYFRVYQLKDFFVFKDVEQTEVWGYNGERTLAAGIMRAINRQSETVCLTGNHGEIFSDFELAYLLDAAGYNVKTNFDLSKEEIPADCTMLITYNPCTDFDVSEGIEEDEKLEAFLSEAGNSYLVFLSNASPSLKNLEAYLAKWGVVTSYYRDQTTGKSYRQTVQNTAQSLTSDGYTIYGKISENATSQNKLAGVEDRAVFKNATALGHATDFIALGDGSYQKGERTFYPVFEASDGAVLWANGVAADGDDALLMTVTEQTVDRGTSFLGVIASTDFATRELLQSAVYENPDVLQRIFSSFGQEEATEGLRLKPFSTSEISTATTAEMLRWTVCLSLIPTLTITAIAVVVLVRRRRA